jgi:hypothetical protein
MQRTLHPKKTVAGGQGIQSHHPCAGACDGRATQHDLPAGPQQPAPTVQLVVLQLEACQVAKAAPGVRQGAHHQPIVQLERDQAAEAAP